MRLIAAIHPDSNKSRQLFCFYDGRLLSALISSRAEGRGCAAFRIFPANHLLPVPLVEVFSVPYTRQPATKGGMAATF